MSNFTVNGTNLDSLFEPLGSFTKRADVGFISGASDISNRFAPASEGTAYGGTTGFRSGGTDIGLLFAAIGSASEYSPGALWMFGVNSQGQLGDNTTINKSTPVQTISGGTNWKQGALNTIVSSIKTDGSLWLWADNGSGRLGDNTTINRSSPVQTVSGGTNWRFVAAGTVHTAAIKTDGSLWLWGANNLNALGDNTAINRSSPVQTISGGTNWRSVNCGDNYTAAIKTDGSLWTWGRNNSGQLGDNTAVVFSKSSPVQTISGGTNWRSVGISGGSSTHTVAIKTDGSLWLWGLNNSGNLGDNTAISRSSPVQTISGGTNWKSVGTGTGHTAAIKTDGSLWLWGRNGPLIGGQLGDNTVIAKSSPIQTVSGGTNWKSVTGGTEQTAAIKTDGSLWLWGRNNTSQLGDNTIINRSSPVQTSLGGTNWKSAYSGALISAGIKL